jgi:hypothetical protein
MTTNDSLELFLRLISERHAALISESQSLLLTLAGEDLSQKKLVAKSALQAATDLRAHLSNNDVPQWLNKIIDFLNPFINGSWSSSDLLKNFIHVKTLLDGHRWVFEQDAETAFDFDSIFDHFKNESRLPELFDQIIRLLEEIESSGEVDSVTMHRALGKVISTIKRSKDGSYFSLISAWEFLLSFLNNYMWGELSKLPLLGTALEALGKTIKETDEEMFKVHKQVQDEMVRTVTAEVKALTNKSAFPFIAYDRSGHLLPSIGNHLLPDATA